MNICLVGKVIKLRPLKIDDAEITLRWRTGHRAKYLNKGAKTLEDQKKWILQSEENGDLNFLIEYKDKGVGMISLYEINHTHHSLILGRLLIGEEEFVGNAPVVFESEMLAMDYAFETLNMHSIYGDVMSSNTGVIKLRKYLHWHEDGRIKEHFCVDGEYQDAVLYSILKNDYYKGCRRILENMTNFFERSKKD